MAVSAGVTSSVSSGNYTTAQSVVLSTTESTGVIYYTIDGTAPTAESTAYTTPIVLAAGSKTYIKAIVVTDGKDNSEILTLYITVDETFLAKIRRAVRRNSSTDVDAELTDIIAECRLDLQRLGITNAKATSETDSLILGAVRSFARWKFGLSNEDAAANKEDYLFQVDELRRMRDYISYAITFVITTGTGESEEEVEGGLRDASCYHYR